MSILQFVAHLAAAQSSANHHAEIALEKAAKLVEAEAKAEIASYQGAAGPFQAWRALADATVADRVEKGFTPNDPLLRTGALRDSIEHRVEGRSAAVGSNLDEAVWQEVGTKTIPPRSFLGHAAATKAEDVARIVGHGAIAALVGHEIDAVKIPLL